MKTMWIIDRITQDIAVCEGPGRTMRELPLSLLPQGAREGDCLWEEDGAFTLDTQETERRRAANQDLFRRLTKPE